MPSRRQGAGVPRQVSGASGGCVSPALEGRRPPATLKYRPGKLWVRQRVPKYRRKFPSKETARKEKVAGENFWKLKMLMSKFFFLIPSHTFHSEQDDRS